MRLTVFCEGGSDRDFFKSIFMPHLDSKFTFDIEFVTYAKKPKDKIQKYLKTVIKREASGTGKYLILSDTDHNNYPNKSLDEIIELRRKSLLRKGFSTRELVNWIIIEIESWYLAGLDDDICNELNLPRDVNTNEITKEVFTKYAEKIKTTNKELMLIILEKYLLRVGITKNESLNQFVKMLIQENIIQSI